MKDSDKTKSQLIEELTRAHQRIAELEAVETERAEAEEMLQHYRDHLEDLVEKRTAALQIANERLRHSEERLTLAIAGIGGALWDEKLDPDASFDEQTGATYFSPEERQILGYGKEETLPANYDAWYKHILPEDQAPVEQRQRDHFEGRTAYLDHEYRIQRRDRYGNPGW